MAEQRQNLFNRFAQSVRRHKIMTVVVVLLVLAGLAGWRMEKARAQSGGYFTARAAIGSIAITVSANATVVATQDVILSFKNSGYVQSVTVSEGQFVKAGTVLATEQASDYRAALEQAEATLESAQAGYAKVPDEIREAQTQLDQAQSNLDLAKTTLAQDEALYAAGAIPLSSLQNAQNTYRNDLAAYQSAQSNLDMAENTDARTAQSQVESAEAGVTLAQNNLAGCEITAPMNGYVVNINGSTGEWTVGGAPPANSSTTSNQFYIEIASNRLELSAEINQADIAKVSIGDPVTFTVDAYPGKTFSGKVATLAAEAQDVEGVQYFQSYITIDDQTGLKAGIPAAVNIISTQKNNVLVVPRAALDYAATLARGGGTYVAVPANGQPRLVPVKTGIENDSLTEITSGLEPGQTVILGSRTGGGQTQLQQHGPSATGQAMHMIGG